MSVAPRDSRFLEDSTREVRLVEPYPLAGRFAAATITIAAVPRVTYLPKVLFLHPPKELPCYLPKDRFLQDS
jgi:hypothetical protein